MPNADLERTLVDASIHNRQHGVTGVLLYDGVRSLQYFEGPPAGLEAGSARIQAASKHTGIQVLVQGAIAQRHFWSWSMAC